MTYFRKETTDHLFSGDFKLDSRIENLDLRLLIGLFSLSNLLHNFPLDELWISLNVNCVSLWKLFLNFKNPSFHFLVLLIRWFRYRQHSTTLSLPTYRRRGRILGLGIWTRSDFLLANSWRMDTNCRIWRISKFLNLIVQLWIQLSCSRLQQPGCSLSIPALKQLTPHAETNSIPPPEFQLTDWLVRQQELMIFSWIKEANDRVLVQHCWVTRNALQDFESVFLKLINL